ncbi:MAG: hypothetical protein GY785_22485 [Gammaproteobacteria bacterium]|nr:hypothetical protein [Gammaproteobacteria bacterium]
MTDLRQRIADGVYREKEQQLNRLGKELAGKHLDMLRYMQILEQPGWKLLWDEFEIHSAEYQAIIRGSVMSILSTRKQWIEI